MSISLVNSFPMPVALLPVITGEPPSIMIRPKEHLLIFGEASSTPTASPFTFSISQPVLVCGFQLVLHRVKTTFSIPDAVPAKIIGLLAVPTAANVPFTLME